MDPLGKEDILQSVDLSPRLKSDSLRPQQPGPIRGLGMLSHRKTRMIDNNGCRLQVPIMVFQIQNWFTIQGSSLQSLWSVDRSQC